MGSEQSHQQPVVAGALNNQARMSNATRLQRGNTIAAPMSARYMEDGASQSNEFRPVSPPISVCSDSDLPYISYTDRPIGDSPKIRNKGHSNSRNVRSNSISSTSSRKPAIKLKQRPLSTAHNIVVVKSAVKEPCLDRDPDLLKLQSIPMFLPVMRGSLALPSSRDPEVLERLQPIHLHNICNRMLTHYNVCASKIATDQTQIMTRVKEVDYHISKLLAAYVEKQKAYAFYAEQFSKVRTISQQLSRCNNLLNQNIESLETLNNMLSVDDRLEPFIWKTD